MTWRCFSYQAHWQHTCPVLQGITRPCAVVDVRRRVRTATVLLIVAIAPTTPAPAVSVAHYLHCPATVPQVAILLLCEALSSWPNTLRILKMHCMNHNNTTFPSRSSCRLRRSDKLTTQRQAIQNNARGKTRKNVASQKVTS